MNTFTTTNPIGNLAIVALDNKVYYAPIMLVIKQEAYNEMAFRTLKRFSYGCQLLAAGIEWDVENETMREVDDIPYAACEDHDEARVQLWVKGSIPVYNGEQLVPMSVNIFTEMTLVEDFVGYMRMVVEAMPMFTEILNTNAPDDAPPPQAKQENELDEFFPRDEHNNPISQPSTQPTPQQAVPSLTNPPPAARSTLPPKYQNAIRIGSYDYKLKAQYNSDYVGQVVAVDVSSVARRMEAKKDGSGTYECIRVYGYRNGLPSDKDFPTYDLTIMRPREERNFGNWKEFFRSVPEADLAAPGTSINKPMRFYFELAKSEKDERIFWNLERVEILGQEQQTNFPAATEEAEQQSFVDDQPSYYNYPDDIPY